MASMPGSKRTASAARRKPKKSDSRPRPAPDEGFQFVGSLKSLAGKAFDLASAVADASITATSLLPGSAEQKRLLKSAGRVLRKLRETAGVTVEDLSRAVDLDSPELLLLAERGKTALPFELILRLAAVLARNDPVPLIFSLTKAYSPGLMRALQALGVARMVEHARREHEIVALYCARDRARELSDAEFTRVLKFIEAALDLALDFAAAAGQPRGARKTASARTPRQARK